jgi:exopolysaccharide biosynthesis protein
MAEYNEQLFMALMAFGVFMIILTIILTSLQYLTSMSNKDKTIAELEVKLAEESLARLESDAQLKQKTEENSGLKLTLVETHAELTQKQPS